LVGFLIYDRINNPHHAIIDQIAEAFSMLLLGVFFLIVMLVNMRFGGGIMSDNLDQKEMPGGKDRGDLYEAMVKIPKGKFGTTISQRVTVSAKSPIHAKAMLEAQYGIGSISMGPRRGGL